MKNSTLKILLLFIAITFYNINSGIGQEQKRFYGSTSLEMIFSFGDVARDSMNTSTVMRWAPVLNIQYIYNFDLTNNFGLFVGFDMRNLGFIYKNDKSQKWKHRVYTIGVPVGFKLGNLKSGMFFYAGGQIEYAFNYKEKYFLDGSKQTKDVYWFTDRVNIFQTSVLFGVNFPYGFNIKFKYYFTDLLNTDYVAYDDNGNLYKPYESFTSSNIFYFSLSINMFHRDYEYFHDSITNETIRAERGTKKNRWF